MSRLRPAARMGGGARRLVGALPILLAVPLLAPVTTVRAQAAADTASPASCDQMFRQIKLDSFDEKWADVLRDCDRLLARQPACPQASQAAFFRARALDRSGRAEEALTAYSTFLETHCAAGSLNCDAARIERFTLAGRLWQAHARRPHLDLLLEGARDPGSSGTYAALTLAGLDNAEGRTVALPRLLRAYGAETDADIRNRICLAVLRIDPDKVPCGREPKPPAADQAAADDGPQLISIEIYDKDEGRVELRMNMPVALADAFLRAMPEEARSHMDQSGFDVQRLFQQIRSQHKGQIFFAETEDTRIRVWLQ